MANIPSKPSYTHGSTGTAPATSQDYASGDPVDADNFDYYVYTPLEKIKGIIDILNELDSDDDGIVDGADGASTYSDGGSTVVTRPTDVNFGDKLSVTDDGDTTVTIGTSALDEEEVEDVVDGLVVAGTGINVSYDDGANTLTFSTDDSYVQSEAITAINNDSDHGSTASHNYFAGGHGDLSGVNEQNHHGEPVNYETGHTGWGDGLSDVEIHRIDLQTGETFELERLEFQQQGGGSSSSASVDVYDASAASQIASVNLGSVAKDSGTSGTGNTIIVRITNSTGGAIDAAVRVVGYINGA